MFHVDLRGGLARCAWGGPLCAWVIAAIVIIAAALQPWVPFRTLSADAAMVANVPYYTGALSNIGITLWFVGGAVALFASRRRDADSGPNSARQWLRGLGVLSLTLGADDLLQLHEEVLPALIGSSESAVYAVYAGALLWLVARHGRAIADTDWPILMVAGGFLGLSVASDLAADHLPGDIPVLWRFQSYVFEDGTKLLGIVGWAAYLFRASSALVFPGTPQEFAVPRR